jgi:glycosyltransferase involved in cell wall biosynthesis
MSGTLAPGRWRGRITPVNAEPDARGRQAARAPTAAAGPAVTAIVAAHDEADRIGRTLSALAEAFPGADLVVADDASSDATAIVAQAHGARVVSGQRSRGKGANVTAAAYTVLGDGDEPPLVLLCDADLGGSAARLRPLVDAVADGYCDLAVAAFARRLGGGFGLAVGFAGWAIERRCGIRPRAPISGQRAMRPEVLRAVLPFASGFGMETGMTIDAVRGGFRLRELELDLEHRPTGRTPRGFLHRARQLRDILRAYVARR